MNVQYTLEGTEDQLNTQTHCEHQTAPTTHTQHTHTHITHTHAHTEHVDNARTEAHQTQPSQFTQHTLGTCSTYCTFRTYHAPRLDIHTTHIRSTSIERTHTYNHNNIASPDNALPIGIPAQDMTKSLVAGPAQAMTKSRRACFWTSPHLGELRIAFYA